MIADSHPQWQAAGTAGIVSLAAVAILLPAGLRLGRFARATNFEGRTVRTAGLALALALALGGAVALPFLSGTRSAAPWLATVVVALGFGLFGAIDDRWGDRSASGFGGHLRAALRGRVTTGFLKVIGGGLTALFAAWLLRPGGPWGHWLLDGAAIALSANALNLMDTRPARAGAAFVALSAALLPFGASPALSTIPAALAFLAWDRRRVVMLGDAGSNTLGAVWAVSLSAAAPWWGMAAFLLLLLGFHAWTEGHSLNRAIAAHRLLNALDLRLRGAPREETCSPKKG